MKGKNLWRIYYKHSQQNENIELDFREQEFDFVKSKRVTKAETTSKYHAHYFAGLKSDLETRDFTINGLYYDLLEKSIVDFSSGIEDIRIKEISMLNDYQRTFVNGIFLASLKKDPCRFPRMLRFAVKFDLKISPLIKFDKRFNTKV